MSQSQLKPPSNAKIILFMVILSFICALILSSLASMLQKPKEVARQLDQSKQMMIAAHILSHDGFFLMKDEEGNEIPAKFEKGGALVPGTKQDIATKEQILTVYEKRLVPLLTDDKGDLITFADAGVKTQDYISDYKKTGYYREPKKLIYEILPNVATEKKAEEKPVGYVIPVNGFGLWDAIYGYLAVKPDGNTIIGISWYDQKETPGLGANIADAPWQGLFPGKQIFQEPPSGETDFKTAPIGIVVVKGKVSEVLGDVPKAKSAVDGMAGATLTGNGVTDAYRDVLDAYRPFLIKIHEESSNGAPS